MTELIKPKSDYPSNVSGYTELAVLGRGAFGQVKKMIIDGTDQEVAVKRLSIGEYLKRKFPREAKGAKKTLIKEMNREFATITAAMDAGDCATYFPRYYTHFEGDDNDSYYVVSELIDGFNLDSNNPLAGNLEETFRFASDVLTGLHCIHSRNIVHRDIKPGNLMFDRKRNGYVLVDFGLACFNTMGSDEEMNCGSDAGTKNYIDIESVLVKAMARASNTYALPDTSGQPYDDIYALAISIMRLYKPSINKSPEFKEYLGLIEEVAKVSYLINTGQLGNPTDNQELYDRGYQFIEKASIRVMQILAKFVRDIGEDSEELMMLIGGMLRLNNMDRIQSGERVRVLRVINGVYRYDLKRINEWNAKRFINFLRKKGLYTFTAGDQRGGSSMEAITSRNAYNSAKADYLNLIKITN